MSLRDAIIIVIISIARALSCARQIPRARVGHVEEGWRGGGERGGGGCAHSADRSGERRDAIEIRQSWGPRVHISRSACVNGFRAVGLLLRSCVTQFYNANATDTEQRGGIVFRRPGSTLRSRRHVLICKLKCK